MKRINNREKKRAGLQLHILFANMAAVLFCLTLISVHFASGLYARYQSAASGSDSARVAAWVVAVSGSGASGGKLSIDCNDTDTENDTASYQITVSNTENGKICEVSFEYDLIVTLSEALPAGVDLEIKQGDTPKELQKDAAEKVYTYTGQFAAGNAETHQYTLIFTGSTDLEEDIEGINVDIRVVATQKD